MELKRYLDDLEERLRPEEEDAVLAGWTDWAYNRNTVPFDGVARKANPSRLEWPEVNINDALADDEMMLYSQFRNVHATLESGAKRTLYVRANYGVGNVATMFGAPLFIMDRAMDTLPNVRAIGPDAARAFAAGEKLPDMNAGNGEHIFRILDRFTQIRKEYPKIAKYVRVEQPDLQSPMDNCELLWGSDIFYAFYDEPEVLHALLSRITDLLDAIISRFHALFPREDGTCSYFTHIGEGGIALRDDSAMNLSPALYAEFMAPYDGRLLEKYGGIVHFCGRGDHYIETLAKQPGLHGINMSQPHLNDMEKILRATVDRGINLSVNAKGFSTDGHDTTRLLYW